MPKPKNKFRLYIVIILALILAVFLLCPLLKPRIRSLTSNVIDWVVFSLLDMKKPRFDFDKETRKSIKECKKLKRMVVHGDLITSPRDDCLGKLAVIKGDARICTLMDAPYACITQIAMEKGDYKICDLLETSFLGTDSRIICYADVASFLKDSKPCDYIPRDEKYKNIKEACYEFEAGTKP